MAALTQRKRGKTAEEKQAEARAQGPRDPDVHHEYEFGGSKFEGTYWQYELMSYQVLWAVER